MRFRPPGPAQSRQGLSDPAPLRRTRTRTCAWRQIGIPRYSQILAQAASIGAALDGATRPLADRQAPGIVVPLRPRLGSAGGLSLRTEAASQHASIRWAQDLISNENLATRCRR